jgi:hypothetical protein
MGLFDLTGKFSLKIADAEDASFVGASAIVKAAAKAPLTATCCHR